MMRINAVMCDAISEDIGSVSLREVDLPAPGPGEVRVPDTRRWGGRWHPQRSWDLRWQEGGRRTLRAFT